VLVEVSARQGYPMHLPQGHLAKYERHQFLFQEESCLPTNGGGSD